VVLVSAAASFPSTALAWRLYGDPERAAELVDRFGPFEPWFFYGVAAVEIVMMTAFGVAVVQGIVHRKELESHAWWMVSTVFLIMMPALGRGVQNFYVGLHRAEMPNVDIMFPIYPTQLAIVGVLLLAAWRFAKLRHPATWLAVGVNLFTLLAEPIGRSPEVQHLLKAAIRG
jgi:hypothetical protein